MQKSLIAQNNMDSVESLLVVSSEKSRENLPNLTLSKQSPVQRRETNNPVQQKEVSQDVISVTEEFEDNLEEEEVRLEFSVND